jgi:hypothetical protein
VNVLQLPSNKEAIAWALDLQGDYGPDPEVEYERLGIKPTIAVESNSPNRMDWRLRSVVRRVEVAVYPSTEFAAVVNEPERQSADVPRGSRHEIYLDQPLAWPVFVRVQEKWAVREHPQTLYTLYVVEPEHVEMYYERLEPRFEGLTREEVEKLMSELGLPQKEFGSYSATGKPERLDFCAATAVNLSSTS